MHMGGVLIFEQPAGGLGYERLVKLISDRIALVPRYRQKVRWIPGRLANPIWVDDQDFDITYHVRRSALPKPGSDAQLHELVVRLQGRQLDRSRPLWELYLVEGLADNRVALVTKTHQAMVDGIAVVDLGTVLFDVTPTPRDVEHDAWLPAGRATSMGLVTDAVFEAVRRPSQVLDTARSAFTDAQSTALRATSLAGTVVTRVRTVVRPMTLLQFPVQLKVRSGAHRRVEVARTQLADYQRVRDAHGGTVNDVVLAVVAGALRGWLLAGEETVPPAAVLRALVPVSVRTQEHRGELGNRVTPYFMDLPIGEADPVARLRAVSRAMGDHHRNGAAVDAQSLVQLAGFAPPTIALLGARAAFSTANRRFKLVVTNVPGPQFALYAAGARLLEMYPVVPLAKGQAVSIGLTSYNGKVVYGLNADRDAMPDLQVLARCIELSMAELAETVL